MLRKFIVHPTEEILAQSEYLSKLGTLLKKLSASTQSDDFLGELKEIYQTLEHIDEEPDPTIFAMTGGYVREFITTFLILFFGTKDINKSLEAHSQIKSLTKYIVLLDRHYDEKNYELKVRADHIFKKLMMNVDGYVQEAIIHNMATLWATATYEIKLRGRMFKGDEIFHKKEIRYHIFQKSSDTVLYGVILDNYIPSFNQNVMQLLHYNQCLLDILDDLNDLPEDILRHDLNVFTMAARRNMELSEIYGPNASQKEILKASEKTINLIINEFELVINQITVPDEYSFMKIFSSDYLKQIRNNLQTALQ